MKNLEKRIKKGELPAGQLAFLRPPSFSWNDAFTPVPRGLGNRLASHLLDAAAPFRLVDEAVWTIGFG
ncbi:hypothetical protein [Halopseudomonas oceani]|uniref:hypothetical protein n=1 Tax=Halopseudomonas oceani TaxID=1708783 RepID=UPI002AA7E840|nr:hypothetical protein [Halopseudomonas oceani]